MKLRKLQIDRLPGIQPGFTVSDIGPGINVITGPNASGKSSLMRALRACLYAQELQGSQLSVAAEFETDAGEMLLATRAGRELHWYRGGSSVAAPPLPEHHLLPCYTLHVEDLLASDNATDEHIAGQLRRELAGGYDIPAVAAQAPFRVTSTRARAASHTLAHAERELRACQASQEALLRDEQRLEALEQDSEAARQAGGWLDSCQQALLLLSAQRECKNLEVRLQGFPADMAQLRGDEPEQLRGLRERQQAQQALLDALEQDTARACARLESSALTSSDVQQLDVEERRPALKRLRELEHQIKQLLEDKLRATAELEGCIARLGGQPQQMPSLEPASLQQVESDLGEKRGVDAEVRELRAALERLATGDGAPGELELLRQARHELLQWLSAPAPAAASRLRRRGLLLLGITAVIGAGAAYWLHPLLTPALLLPAAYGLYLGWGDAPVADNGREMARQRYPSDAITAPSAWQQKAVQSRLQALDQEVLAAEQHAQSRRQVAELEQLLNKRQQQQERLDTSLGELARRVGFDPRYLDASFERWLRVVSELDRAQQRKKILETTLAQRQDEAGALRTSLLQFLASHGESGEAGTTEVLEQRLGQLQERIRQKQEAADTLQRNKQQREQVNRELERARQGSAAVFERTKIPGHSEAVLQERIKALDDWRQLKHALDQQRSIERDRRGHLEAATELLALVETGDESELLRQQDHYIRQSGQWQSLIEEITRIRNAIDQAGRERRLEAARAAVQQARDELSDALDETLFADAGGFLLNQVSQEYVRSSQPAALRRAADWFALFTRHQFQLQFPDGAGIGFTALDNSSAEQRHLSELSSGTRMQLLLAVRLAFALQAERGRESLPLILDETLTTSDPQRFQAVAESLHTLVCEEGRQIFYLSSQPGDIAYWREVDPEARILDLPVIRQQAGALTDPDRFMLPEREAVPDPGSDSAEQYAVRISVPAIALWNAVENMPIFYLLRDQLALLQRLLQAGIERLGQLQSLLATEQSALLLNPEEVSLLSRRCEAARRWQQARRQGQGRPIDRSVLEAAEAVSDVQLDRVDEQSRAMNGDAAALIQCLEDGKVSRFRSNKIEELCEWFLENGYIDPAVSLNAEEIDQRVLSALIATPDESGAALQEAQELTASLENGLRV